MRKKQFRLSLTLASLAALGVSYLQGESQSPLRDLEDTIVKLYQEKSDAVVSVKIATKAVNADGKDSTALTVISGFFISEDGKILTNAIPEENVVRLWIVKNGQSHIAELVGIDQHTNISLLKAINLPDSFTAISIEGPEKSPRIGSFAFAVTSPLDFSPSPAWGFVTGFESQFSDLTFPFTYTRVSIPVGPAEGGSPVFSMDGKLLGISVAALPDVNSGYIVPTTPLRKIVADLEAKGRANYGSVPVVFEEKADSQRKQVKIKSIVPASQAEKAGIKAGDILTACGDVEIHGVNQLRDLIFFTEPGAFLPMTILRNEVKYEFALLVEANAETPATLVTAQPNAISTAN